MQTVKTKFFEYGETEVARLHPSICGDYHISKNKLMKNRGIQLCFI